MTHSLLKESRRILLEKDMQLAKYRSANALAGAVSAIADPEEQLRDIFDTTNDPTLKAAITNPPKSDLLTPKQVSTIAKEQYDLRDLH
jgi:hypothetical protein